MPGLANMILELHEVRESSSPSATWNPPVRDEAGVELGVAVAAAAVADVGGSGFAEDVPGVAAAVAGGGAADGDVAQDLPHLGGGFGVEDAREEVGIG